jgi:hypothetical protein
MQALDELEEVEKTTVFGTAVHAVLRTPEVQMDRLTSVLTTRGLDVSRIDLVTPSLEDVFLDVVEHA